MDTILQVGGIAALQIANILVMYILAWFFTEVITLPWRVKPFTCRECLAFWFTWIGGIALAFAVTGDTYSRLTLCWTGFLLGIINYLFIKTKFKIYE